MLCASGSPMGAQDIPVRGTVGLPARMGWSRDLSTSWTGRDPTVWIDEMKHKGAEAGVFTVGDIHPRFRGVPGVWQDTENRSPQSSSVTSSDRPKACFPISE